MTYLLDVNVLIALTDRSHAHHALTLAWFEAVGYESWATCPITENGVLRIVGNVRYRNSPDGVSAVLEALRDFTSLPGHVFWPDDVSFISDKRMDLQSVMVPNDVTDIYLLLLAQAHGGQMATLDRKIPAGAVTDGLESLCIISS